jgi:hypothetical protein
MAAVLELVGVTLDCSVNDLAAQAATSESIFAEDFSHGLDQWRFPNRSGATLIDGGAGRGMVLQLRTVDQQGYALIEGSASWGDVRIEGFASFPENQHNYLGFIYRYADNGRRIDFGSFYIKGNGSYIQANPHYDTNVGRTLHPESRVDLTGNSAVVIGEWQPFALEVVGGDAHLYAGDLEMPVYTLQGTHAARGAFGFKPRNPGARVLIDNVSARSIDGFTYRGDPIPNTTYTRDAYVTEWSMLGPLSSNLPAGIEGTFDTALTVQDDGRSMAWRPFSADHRGAVITSSVTEYRGSRRVAYFHTSIESDEGGRGTLVLSSADDLSIWVNGVFRGFFPRQDRAWWDSAINPEHARVRAGITLEPGTNDIVLRAAGGVYATGGFYLAVEGSPGG